MEVMFNRRLSVRLFYDCLQPQATTPYLSDLYEIFTKYVLMNEEELIKS